MLFKQLFDIFSTDLIESVILVGSASRGELSFIEKDSLLVRSDIEFYVVTEDINEVRSKIGPKIRDVELKYNSIWPEFHIDISYLTSYQFRSLKPWIRHYELIENGKIFFGSNIISALASVTVKNLDYCELNEIALWRMLALLSRFPIKLIDNRKDIPLDFGFALARNILDLTTWLLPGKEILIGNYTDRVSFWKNELDKETKEAFSFISDSVLEECILCRRKEDLDLDLTELLQNTIKTWLYVYDVVQGKVDFNHLASSKGFRRVGFFRLARLYNYQ